MAYPEIIKQQDNINQIQKELKDIKSEIQIIKNITRKLNQECSNINIVSSSTKLDKSAQERKLLTLDNANNTLENVLTYHDIHSAIFMEQSALNDSDIKAKTVIRDLSSESEHKTNPETIYREQSMNVKNLAEQISKLRASQSPIAISVSRCPIWSSLEPLKFKRYWDNEANGVLLNTGQTAFFTLDSTNRPCLSGGPLIGEYIFEQMHFHWSVDDFTGCEHVLDGHGYAAECHLVHYNSKYESMEAAVAHPDGLAVVGFLLEAVDVPNPCFDQFVEGLDLIKKRDNAVHLPSESLAWMDRADVTTGSYVTYKGSLTTPPYTECVTWIIYEKPVQIGTEQLGLLRQLEGNDSNPIERNVRPTQRHPPGHSVIYVKQVKSKL
ncbi:carbonic anhydrase 13 [Zerene cesonia]|uniref:carbonic anhydrase 13 n=1 Tax=Zerene cesonia TaxID=33412 RepID=UPI0018E533BC|nr:carbonic anhydrase 13 [Zerene cesonia]